MPKNKTARPKFEEAPAATPPQLTPASVPVRIRRWLWPVAVLLSIAWQPFALGFYVDDWVVSAAAAHEGRPFSWSRLHYIYAIDPSRPGILPFRFLFSSLFSDHAILWHGALLLVNAMIALLLGWLICLTLDLQTPRRRFTAFSLGLCWLLLPWNVAALFWPVLLPNMLVLAVFGLLCALLLDGWTKHKSRALWAALLYLWICVSYEAFYLQWIPLLLIGLLIVLYGRARMKDFVRTAVSLFSAQLAAAGWYLASKSITNTQKPVVPDWPQLAIHNLRVTVGAILLAVDEIRTTFAVVGVLLLCLLALVCFRSLMDPARRSKTRAQLLVTASCALGGIISIIMFTLGGRVVDIGIDSRSLVLLNFWSVLAAAIWIIEALRFFDGWSRRIFTVVLACCGVCLVAGHLIRAGDWAASWRAQQKILAEAPISELKQTPPDARILLINETNINGAPVFMVPWDINHAMPLTYPFLEGRRFVVYSLWGGPMTWDGARLAYVGQPPLETTSTLYVWTPRDMRFWKAMRPFRVNQNLTIDDLKLPQR